MIVRRMHPEEIDVTVNLFNYYKMEAIESIPEIEAQYDPDSVLKTIRTYNTYNEYIWFNAYEGQRPVGLIAGCITALPWNEELLVAHIDMIYILDSHRNMESVRMLYNEFEAWARTCKCHKITAGDIGINPERTRKLYEYLGFEPGVFMIKEFDE